MAVLTIENQTSDVETLQEQPKGTSEPVDQLQLAVELGIWLSGLESFVSGGYRSFRMADPAGSVDTLKEFELTREVLLRCASINSRLMADSFLASETQIAGDRQLAGLGRFFRDSILLGECMIRSGSVGVAEWEAWSRSLAERLVHTPGFDRMIRVAKAAGDGNLPDVFRDVEASADPGRAELTLILPRFGRVLKWLSVIGEMLRQDEPLKPALLIFSSVNEQIQDLINSINNRLERFSHQEDETFSALDAAAYTAAIELKKVYTQELAGLARMRPSPTIYARMETSYSLLNDGFQQMLAEFARSIDPRTNVIDLFPDFATKLERSLRLRQDLNDLAELVRKVEGDPEKNNVDEINNALFQFLGGSMRYLFYKDTEAVERFAEEIIVTKQNRDLVQILHRFGAFLDTLFGQVNLRAVLAKHPFKN